MYYVALAPAMSPCDLRSMYFAINIALFSFLFYYPYNTTTLAQLPAFPILTKTIFSDIYFLIHCPLDQTIFNALRLCVPYALI